MPAAFVVFKGEGDEYFWHLKAANGEIVAASEGYVSKSNAERGVNDMAQVCLEAIAERIREQPSEEEVED